jgi:hypothetical protein
MTALLKRTTQTPRRATLSLKDRVWAFHLAHMSKPAEDRPIYQELLRGRVTRILELGLGLGDRSVRLVETAAHFCDSREIHYTGVDLFEGRDTAREVGLSLKLAHTKLARTGAHIRLVPGDAFSGVARIANSLKGLDLVVISGNQPAEILDRTWFYFPRMIDDQTQVFLQKPCRPGESAPYDRIGAHEIGIWAGRTQRRAA